MTRNLLRTMAASASVLPGAAVALGLGPIDVKTVLDQPLEAHIPIVSARPGELDGVSANLASRELFKRMGLERPSLLRQLNFTVEGLDSGAPFIRVTSKTPIREPSINILLEVSWTSGRMLRDFSVLLDPPLSVRRAPKTRAVAVAPTVRSRVSLPSQSSLSRQSSAAGFDGSTYGPVASGETLWAIAEYLRPDRSISVSQMMLALLHANPDAFYQPNVNSLNAGATLRMPGSEELAALTRGEAKVEVDRHHAAIGASWARGSSALGSGPSNVEDAIRGHDSNATAKTELSGNTGTGLGQIRLVEAEDTGVVETTGDATAVTAPGSGHGPLIQLESGGVALQLVGLEGLAERMPTIIGVHDAALATEIVSARIEERLPIAGEPLQEEEISSPASAESDPSTNFVANATELQEASEGTAPNERIESSVDRSSDAIAAAQAFRAQAGIASMAGDNADAVSSQPTAELPLRSDLASAGPDSLESATDANGFVDVISTDDLLDFHSATITPLEAETFDTVADAEGQQATSSTELGADNPLLPGEGIDQAEPLEQLTALDVQPADLFSDEPRAAPLLDTEDSSTSLAAGTGAFLSPKSIATYGGGVLAVLLLMLALIRRSLGAKGAQPETLARKDDAASVGAVEAEWSKPVADVQHATATSDMPEVEVEETSVDEEEVDPVAKADVLIAMGEYAQAIDLLENALEATPDNAHVALTILQTHLSAESGGAFADFAARNRELLQGSGLWPQVVTMGTDLCPEHELFGGDSSVEEAQEESAAATESPVMTTQELPSALSMLEQPVAETLEEDGQEQDQEQDTEDFSADILEFKLPEEEDENDEQPDLVAEATRTESAEEDDLGLDFDLEEFSLDGSGGQDSGHEADPSVDESPLESPLTTEFESPLDEIAAGEAAFGDDATLKLESIADLADEDIDATLKVAAISDFPDLEFDTSDQQEPELDLDLDGEGVPAPSDASAPDASEEDSFVDTKLDLATAYLEMGDSDGARSLYEEVVEEGNDMQRKMAEDALSKMS